MNVRTSHGHCQNQKPTGLRETLHVLVGLSRLSHRAGGLDDKLYRLSLKLLAILPSLLGLDSIPSLRDKTSQNPETPSLHALFDWIERRPERQCPWAVGKGMRSNRISDLPVA